MKTIEITVTDEDSNESFINITDSVVEILDSFIELKLPKSELILKKIDLPNGMGACYELINKIGSFRFEFTDRDVFKELEKFFEVVCEE